MQFFKVLFLFLAIFPAMGFYHALGQQSPFVSEVFEYKPAPGQFINTVVGSPAAAQKLIGSSNGGLSLGAFGGYVMVGFDHTIENDPNNPYGVDFTVYGNANTQSSEPASVYVMVDSNKNGKPDENWFLLAGSDYFFASSIPDYEITYTNPGFDSTAYVPWNDHIGNAGFIYTNTFHTQPYYPKADSFPHISQTQYSLNGLLVKERLNLQNDSYITSYAYPFGFADNTPRNFSNPTFEPDNPYTQEIEGAGGDAFDISWAVDKFGNHVHFEGIDFIKIQTAVNASAGWLGELSSEIMGVVDVDPNSGIKGDSLMLVLEPIFRNLEIEESILLTTHLFIYGIPVLAEPLRYWSSDESIISVDAMGELKAHKLGNAWIYTELIDNIHCKDSVQFIVKNPVSASSKKHFKVSVYPNPASSFITINGLESWTLVALQNTLGVSYLSRQINNQTIQVSHLPAGMYWLTIKSGKDLVTISFIKK